MFFDLSSELFLTRLGGSLKMNLTNTLAQTRHSYLPSYLAPIYGTIRRNYSSGTLLTVSSGVYHLLSRRHRSPAGVVRRLGSLEGGGGGEKESKNAKIENRAVDAVFVRSLSRVARDKISRLVGNSENTESRFSPARQLYGVRRAVS